MSETAAAVTPMADHIEQFWRYLEKERVRILVDLHRDGYCDSSSFNDEFAKALLAERTAAQQKIVELEAERDALKLEAQSRAQELLAIKKAVDELHDNTAGILEQLTAERQRRESAEAVAKPFAFGDPVLEQILFDGIPDDAPGTITATRGAFRRLRQHFTRYPTASDSEERGG